MTLKCNFRYNDNYLGTVPNDSAGRSALWNDIVTHHDSLMTARAIQDFTSKDITVSQGEDAETSSTGRHPEDMYLLSVKN